jgi:hypothetical protein
MMTFLFNRAAASFAGQHADTRTLLALDSVIHNSALVRNTDRAPLLEAFGGRPVIGTLDDAAIISAEA